MEEIALRLALTLIAAGVIGLNRSLRGRAAGVRTMILVGLAACAAMIQADLLLPISGKTDSSFAASLAPRPPRSNMKFAGPARKRRLRRMIFCASSRKG